MKEKFTVSILNFIIEDKDYIKDHKDDESDILSIFQGLNLENIDEEFLLAWKNINLEDIFGNMIKDIYEVICESINDFKNFGALLKILNRSDDLNKKKYFPEDIELMQNKFIFLLVDQNKIEENDFKADLVELLYYSDLQNNSEFFNFLKNLNDKIKFNIMKNIYHDLLIKYQEEISSKTKNFISSYIIDNQKDDISTLLEFAEKFKSFRNDILKNLENYKLLNEDFWQIGENYRIKLFKGLLEKAEISKEEYQEKDYVKNSFEVIKELEKKFNNNTILYKDIIIFF